MKVKLLDEEGGRIELALDASVRLHAGARAAAGGLFATVAAQLLRLPMPFPFKIVPLAFVGVGIGVSAASAVVALTDYGSSGDAASRSSGSGLRSGKRK
jgi:hypothetical protein